MPELPSKKITVLIVDDHTIVRQGLRTFLELQDDIAVVGEAPNGRMAVEMAEQLKPNVILMDLLMPELDGISATRQITALGLPIHVIALTSFIEDERVIPAIQAGACSYILKDISPSELVETVRAAHRGEARLHPDVTRKLMSQVAHPPASAPVVADLTEREIEVARLVAKGLSNREIAERLVISEKTVKPHVSSILSKLGLEDRTQLAIYALKNGLTD
jgi:two-component system, NarL family, response regulator LiaR